LPISRENLQNISTVLRANFGEDLLAKAIAADAERFQAKIVIVEGIRRFSDIVHLKDLPNFFLLAIDADPHIRYERIVRRNENAGDKAKTFEEFLKDQENEADRQIPEVMRAAKYFIENDGSMENLHKKIDEILEKIRQLPLP
jgi:dephospho-CoA kinase